MCAHNFFLTFTLFTYSLTQKLQKQQKKKHRFGVVRITTSINANCSQKFLWCLLNIYNTIARLPKLSNKSMNARFTFKYNKCWGNGNEIFSYVFSSSNILHFSCERVFFVLCYDIFREIFLLYCVRLCEQKICLCDVLFYF